MIYVKVVLRTKVEGQQSSLALKRIDNTSSVLALTALDLKKCGNSDTLAYGGEMNLERMRLFAEVVKRGNFSKAADYLDVSKAYLSTQIKNLEKDLGTQLLIRNTRNMRLTPAGETLLEQASKLSSFWHDTKALLQSSEDSVVGNVRFTAPSAMMKTLLMPVLRPIYQKYPGIHLVTDTGNTVHNLVSSRYDFAIRITNTPPEDMVAKKLMSYDYVCCATPSYFLQQSSEKKEPEENIIPRVPEDLSGHACLTLSYWNKWQFFKNDTSHTVELDGVYQCSENSPLKKAALMDLGIARLPRYIVEPELASGELVELFTDYANETRDVYLLYPQVSKRPERVSLVLKCIAEHFCEGS